MSGEDDKKLWLMLGEMKAGIENLGKEVSSLRVEAKANADALHERITYLATSGCAKGAEHERRLGVLEKDAKATRRIQRRPILAGSAAGGGIAAVVIAAIEIIKAWKGSTP